VQRVLLRPTTTCDDPDRALGRLMRSPFETRKESRRRPWARATRRGEDARYGIASWGFVNERHRRTARLPHYFTKYPPAAVSPATTATARNTSGFTRAASLPPAVPPANAPIAIAPAIGQS